LQEVLTSGTDHVFTIFLQTFNQAFLQRRYIITAGHVL